MRLRFAFAVVFLIADLMALAVPRAAMAFETPAKQAILLDLSTGTMLYEKNADERMPTSSMSKVLTMYLVFEALEDGRLKLTDELPVSEKAWRMGGSKMFVELGKRIPVEDLVRGVIVQSGNDACIVLAEGIAGSEENFAVMMNAKAQELGMANSHFTNATGWPDPEHYSTARDLAILAVRMVRDFPQYYPYYAEKEFTWHNIRQPNRNPLIYRSIGGDGIKTGHTEAAGYGLIGSAVQGDRRLVMVFNGLESEKARAEESEKLLDWGFRTFVSQPLFAAGETVDSAKVWLGRQKEVPLVVDQDIRITLPVHKKGQLKVAAQFVEPVAAPFNQGDVVGKLVVDIPDIGQREFPLKAGAGAEKLGLFPAAIAKAQYLVTGAN